MALTEQRRGITILRAADAPDLSDTDFMPVDETSTDVPLAVTEMLAAGAVAGAELKLLARDAGGFSLVYAWFKADYPLPRHSHNVDCLYYVISGSAVMGNVTLRAGDSFFVPAEAPYQYTAGPDGVEILEIRHGSHALNIKLSESPERWGKMVEAFRGNRQRWEETTISPTFAANAG